MIDAQISLRSCGANVNGCQSVVQCAHRECPVRARCIPSVFALPLPRLGWSPINHMGKNPCMQRTLRALKASKEARAGGAGGTESAEAGAAWRGLAGSNGSTKSSFTSEEIMRTNLERTSQSTLMRPPTAPDVRPLARGCLPAPRGAPSPHGCRYPAHSRRCRSVSPCRCVRPCYGSGVAGEELWHDEALPACRNIYFTPLVHSMYALHLRRWLRIYPRESFLLLRFDDLAPQQSHPPPPHLEYHPPTLTHHPTPPPSSARVPSLRPLGARLAALGGPALQRGPAHWSP